MGDRGRFSGLELTRDPIPEGVQTRLVTLSAKKAHDSYEPLPSLRLPSVKLTIGKVRICVALYVPVVSWWHELIQFYDIESNDSACNPDYKVFLFF